MLPFFSSFLSSFSLPLFFSGFSSSSPSSDSFSSCSGSSSSSSSSEDSSRRDFLAGAGRLPGLPLAEGKISFLITFQVVSDSFQLTLGRWGGIFRFASVGRRHLATLCGSLAVLALGLGFLLLVFFVLLVAFGFRLSLAAPAPAGRLGRWTATAPCRRFGLLLLGLLLRNNELKQSSSS